MKKDPVIENRKARHDYEILETLEVGIALKGYEVKSLREGRGNIRESYARLENSEVFLYNMHIAAYQPKVAFGLDPYRPRKLLLKKREIKKLIGKVQQKGLTLIPLKLYFSQRGWVKVLLAVAQGRKKGDKRRKLREKEAKQQIQQAMRVSKLTTILLLFLLLGCGSRRQEQKAAPASTKPPVVEKKKREQQREAQVSVYYLNAVGDLVAQKRDRPAKLKELLDAMREEKKPYSSALPKGLNIELLRQKGSTVYLNISKDSPVLSGKSSAEALWVQAIVLTFTSVKGIQAVQFLIDGKRVPALSSGIEIGVPLHRTDF